MTDLKTVTFDASQWQPIETAPNEMELLGWREDCGLLLVMHTSFDRFASERECDETDEETLFQKDWFGSAIPGGFERLEGSQAPTHWMPLPAAPGAAPTPAAQSAGQEAVRLPDGSGFMVASLPLPSDHWLYAPRSTEWDDARDTSADTPHPIISNEQRDAVIAAVRYAVRGATMCGQEMDFDPDALVLNAAYALCGPVGNAAPVNGGERDTVEVAVALEQQRTLAIVKAVRDINFGESPTGMPTPASAAYDLACEEIERRVRTEQWELDGVPAPLPSAERAADAQQASATNARLLRALEEIVKNDPFNQSSAGVIARAALASPAKVGDLPTLEALELFAANLAKDGRLTWAGFRKDSDDRHTIPIISPATYKLVCAAIAEWASPAKEQK